MTVAGEEPSKKAMVVFLIAGRMPICDSPSSGSKRLGPRIFVGILLPFIHLLLESFRLFLVGEGQASHAVFKLEGVEEGSVLVVLEGIIDLLVPDYTAVRRLQHVSEVLGFHRETHTDMSTSLIQSVLPTKSLARTAAPCSPVYVHRDGFG